MDDGQLLINMGIRIAARRRELGFTQEYLADQVGVSVQMISNLELGKKAIRPNNLAKVCQILNISADYILTGKTIENDISGLSAKILKLSTEQQKAIHLLIESIIAKQ